MSVRNISWKVSVFRADILTTFEYRLILILNSDSLNLPENSEPIQGLIFSAKRQVLVPNTNYN